MNRTVFAASPVASGVSLAALTEGDPIPRIGYLPAPAAAAAGERDIARALRRIATTADSAVDKIIAANPVMVVMPTLILGSLDRDSSGPRRAGIWWRIATGVTEAGIPLAAYPPLALQKWLGRSKTDMTRMGHSWVTGEVKRVWTGARRDMSEDFRWDTLGYAGVAAMALGIPTAVEPTAERLKLLRSGDWPADLTPPRHVSDFAAA